MGAEESRARAATRKDDHLRLAGEQAAAPRRRSDFDDVEFIHHALDGIDASEVVLETRAGPLHWAAPLYINGMTGGTETTGQINRSLAIAARETGLAMASGSVGIALDAPETAAGFRVIREENPDGFVMANIGIGRSADDARRAVDLLQADALQVHLNAVQETVMPEGSRDFSRWPSALEAVVEAVSVPVIVKEVGFGLSRRTLRVLGDMGVEVADVSGSGGTDFARIENARRGRSDYTMLEGYGQSAVACLLDAPTAGPALLASGGIKTPLDVVKALALGARAAGVAGAFLHPALTHGADGVVETIRAWLARLTEMHAMLGAASPDDLRATDLLLRGRVHEFCLLRGIDPVPFSQRRDTVEDPLTPDHTTAPPSQPRSTT